MAPLDIPVPAEILAFEAEAAGRWAKGDYNDIDPENLVTH
jgi:nitrous oxidase accessory protein